MKAALDSERQTLFSRKSELRKSPEVQQKLQTQMRMDILGEFQTKNAAMKEVTKKSYPQPVLERLAAMTADCLSMDPAKRPTAEQVVLALQNMGLSDWENGQYNIQDAPELTLEQAEIQGRFWWIGGETPPSPPESIATAAPDKRHRSRRRRKALPPSEVN
jgi:hypothetical protein